MSREEGKRKEKVRREGKDEGREKEKGTEQGGSEL